MNYARRVRPFSTMVRPLCFRRDLALQLAFSTSSVGAGDGPHFGPSGRRRQLATYGRVREDLLDIGFSTSGDACWHGRGRDSWPNQSWAFSVQVLQREVLDRALTLSRGLDTATS